MTRNRPDGRDARFSQNIRRESLVDMVYATIDEGTVDAKPDTGQAPNAPEPPALTQTPPSAQIATDDSVVFVGAGTITATMESDTASGSQVLSRSASPALHSLEEPDIRDSSSCIESFDSTSTQSVALSIDPSATIQRLVRDLRTVSAARDQALVEHRHLFEKLVHLGQHAAHQESVLAQSQKADAEWASVHATLVGRIRELETRIGELQSQGGSEPSVNGRDSGRAVSPRDEIDTEEQDARITELQAANQDLQAALLAQVKQAESQGDVWRQSEQKYRDAQRQLEQDLARQLAQVAELERILAERSAMESQQATTAADKSKLEQLSRELARLRGERAEVMRCEQELWNRLADREDQFGRLQQSLRQVQQDAQQHQRRLAEVLAEQELREQAWRAEQREQQQRIEAAQARNLIREEQSARLEQQRAEFERERDERDRQLAESQEERSAAQAALASQQVAHDALQRELAASEARQRELAASRAIELEQWRDQAASQQIELQSLRDELERERAEASASLAAMQREWQDSVDWSLELERQVEQASRHAVTIRALRRHRAQLQRRAQQADVRAVARSSRRERLLVQQKTDLEQARQRLQADLMRLSTDLERTRQGLAESRAAHSESRQALVQSREEQASLTRQMEALAGELTVHASGAPLLESTREELAALRQLLAEQQELRLATEDQLAELRAALARQQTDYETLQCQAREREQQAILARQSADKATEVLGMLRLERQTLTEQRDQVARQLVELRAEHERLNASYDALAEASHSLAIEREQMLAPPRPAAESAEETAAQALADRTAAGLRDELNAVTQAWTRLEQGWQQRAEEDARRAQEESRHQSDLMLRLERLERDLRMERERRRPLAEELAEALAGQTLPGVIPPETDRPLGEPKMESGHAVTFDMLPLEESLAMEIEKLDSEEAVERLRQRCRHLPRLSSYLDDLDRHLSQVANASVDAVDRLSEQEMVVHDGMLVEGTELAVPPQHLEGVNRLVGAPNRLRLIASLLARWRKAHPDGATAASVNRKPGSGDGRPPSPAISNTDRAAAARFDKPMTRAQRIKGSTAALDNSAKNP